MNVHCLSYHTYRGRATLAFGGSAGDTDSFEQGPHIATCFWISQPSRSAGTRRLRPEKKSISATSHWYVLRLRDVTTMTAFS